jgi:hypothetical protein
VRVKNVVFTVTKLEISSMSRQTLVNLQQSVRPNIHKDLVSWQLRVISVFSHVGLRILVR